MIDALPLVFGFGRQELIANAGIAGGIVMGLAVVAMLVVSVLPAYSDSWAERLGTTDTTPSGPDPKEVIPGREEPIAAPSTSRSTAPDASTVDAEDENTAIPEPETVGEGQSVDDDSDDDDSDDAGRAEEARENAADRRDDEDPAN